eukprot:CAMPEP_0119004440 /NCGR_PEP_ID=MMETSP1176-20130426/1142_1 /TAXON_ID=265551 /ORGANISM="Synedropsis recta cf, Strain CCMP1620" /LENGTH=349 /DNA_ID=CAMNT_0006956141 /DNA_START=72 /DNA_END=1121 /DNA_ORIENTATION=+
MNAPPVAETIVSNKSVPSKKQKVSVSKSREEAAKVFFSDPPKPPNKNNYKCFKIVCIGDHQGANPLTNKEICEAWSVVKRVDVDKIAQKDRTRYMGLKLLAVEQHAALKKAYYHRLAAWCKELDDAADCHLNWLLYEVDDTNFLDLKTSIDLLEQRVEKYWEPSFPRNHHVALSIAKKRFCHLKENGRFSKILTYLRNCDDHALLQHCNNYATTFHSQQTINNVNAELQNVCVHKDELLREAILVADSLPVAIAHYMESQIMQLSAEEREIPEQGINMEFCRTGVSPFIFSLAFKVSFPLPQGVMMTSSCVQNKLNDDGTSFVCSDVHVNHDSTTNKLVARAKYSLRRH